MKYLYLIVISIILAGCNFNQIEITGTAPGMDGGVVSIIGASGKTYFTEIVKSGKFAVKKQQLPVYGYFTFSILTGAYPRDYEIYLEAGKYDINIPEKEGDYLKITTDSKTQQSLSAFYNFENSIADKFRKEDAKWVAMLNDPKTQLLSDAEFEKITEHIAAGRRREHGLRIATIDMFIKKYPKTDIVPHIITNMDYKTAPQAYYILYKKLTPEVQNSEEGKQIGDELQDLIKQKEAKQTEAKQNSQIPQPSI